MSGCVRCGEDVPFGFATCSSECANSYASTTQDPASTSEPIYEKPHPDDVTAEQVALAIGVTKTTVYNWSQSGRIPSHNLGPRKLRFRLAEVRAAIGDKSEAELRSMSAPVEPPQAPPAPITTALPSLPRLAPATTKAGGSLGRACDVVLQVLADQMLEDSEQAAFRGHEGEAYKTLRQYLLLERRIRDLFEEVAIR